MDDLSSKFTIVTSHGLGGSITDTKRNVESGESVIIAVKVDEHYQLKQWTGSCGSFNEDNLRITITASKNCEVRAEFEKIKYSITVTSIVGGG